MLVDSEHAILCRGIPNEILHGLILRFGGDFLRASLTGQSRSNLDKRYIGNQERVGITGSQS